MYKCQRQSSFPFHPETDCRHEAILSSVRITSFIIILTRRDDLTRDLLKQAGRDPWLENHPPAQAHSAHLIVERPCMLIGRTGHGLVVGDEMTKGG